MSDDYKKARKQGVATFMQQTGRDEYQRLLAEERAAFRGEDGWARADLIEPCACPGCASSSSQEVFAKEGFRYVRCRDCRTLYVNPRVREEALLAYYTTSRAIARWNEVLLTPAQIDYDRAKFKRLLDAAASALPRRPKRKRILDVGASVGTFVALARDQGHDAHGVEPSEDARARARALHGLEIPHRTLEEAAFPDESFDLVTSFEVIEHLHSPAGVLAEVRRILRPGGAVLLLVGGNADSIAMRVMRERSLAFDMARLAYFSPASFSSLLARSGFRVEAVDSIIPEVDVALNYLNWDQPYRPSLEDDTLPRWFRKALERLVAEQVMGYKFWVVARKHGPAPGEADSKEARAGKRPSRRKK